MCVRCRTVICTECTTRFDGINHCAVCVARLKEERPARRLELPAPLRAAAGLLLYVLLGVGAWGLLYMMLLW